MSSLLPGFEYDIFISYRQKDNKHDGWVTEFVEQLKGELEATFKEDISVYFDINPHDGLLETHDVDASLKPKLKCLVFIPILSRTYCDPQSFAWDHEFNAFVELASQDQFGLKVKLPNGNVTSRVLPVRIYDLDVTDVKLCESILGGVLRSVDFIYKSAGVNRPLRATEDHPGDNLNKTYYRDQINKVANSIREIIGAIGNQYPAEENIPGGTFKPATAIRKRKKTPVIAASILALALIVLGILFIPKLLKTTEKANDQSIAVLPFKLLGKDPEMQYQADGIMDAILLHLSMIKNLRVLPRTSVEQYRQTTKTVKTIGRELNAKYILEGSFQKFGDDVKLIVQLINAGEESHKWAKEYNNKWLEIFNVQSEISQTIAREINVAITPGERMSIETPPTSNMAAYDYFLRGKAELNRRISKENIENAISLFEKATEIDPRFTLAWVGLVECYRWNYWRSYDDRSEWTLVKWKEYLGKAAALEPDLKEVRLEEACYYYYYKLDFAKALGLLEKLKSDYPNDADIHNWIGLVLRRFGKLREAVENIEQAISLNPSYSVFYSNLGVTFTVLRDYIKAEVAYKKYIELNPANPDGYSSLINFYINTGQIQKAKEFLENSRIYLVQEAAIGQELELAVLERKYEKVILICDSLSDIPVVSEIKHPVKYPWLGYYYRLLQNDAKAHEYFALARDFLLNKIAGQPDYYPHYSDLGMALAGLHLKEQAIEAGKKALEIKNLSTDPMDGWIPERTMVMIQVMVGEYDEAMNRLDKIMELHGFLSADYLKLDPFWDPVRNHPKFKEIISNPDYQIKLKGD